MAVYIPFPAQVQVIFAEVSVGPALKIWIQIQYITSMALACTAICGRPGRTIFPRSVILDLKRAVKVLNRAVIVKKGRLKIARRLCLTTPGKAHILRRFPCFTTCCAAASFCGVAAPGSLESRAHMRAVKCDLPVENRRDVSVTGPGVGDKPMKGKTRFSCTIMRGGTSKGVFLMEKDLPGNPDLRERIILAAFPVGRVGIRVSKTISDFLTGG